MPKQPLRHFVQSAPSLWILALLFLVFFSIYLFTLNPALFRNDSPETITACITLGVSHPPGYPLHTLLGHLFSLWLVGNPAMTLNLFSAFLSAIGVCLFSLNAWMLLKPLAEKAGRFAVLTACVAGSLCFAFSKNYWSCALAAKGGIYNLQVVLELGLILYLQTLSPLTLTLSPRGRGKSVSSSPPAPSPLRGEGRVRVESFYFFIFLLGLGLANHWPTALLLIPALAVGACHYFANIDSQQIKSFGSRQLLTGLALLAIPLSLYLYLPLRANLYPHLNFGAPFTCRRFFESLLRTPYFKVETLASFVPTALSTLQDKSVYIAQRYWDEFNLLFAQFSFLGIYLLWQRRFKSWLLFLLVVLLTTLAANLVYLQVLPIEYWHLDDHLLTVNWVTGLFGAVGIYFIFIYSKWAGLLFTVLLPVFTFQNHWPANDQKNEFLYFGYGLEALKSMDKGAFYCAESDYDYFSILYLTEVERKRPDVGLTLVTFMNKDYWSDSIRRQYGHPSSAFYQVYCSFANGPVVNEYLKHFPKVAFKPTGTIVELYTSNKSFQTENSLQPLDELWGRYLAPGRRNLHPIDRILVGLCAHPFINMAHYLELKGIDPRTDEFENRGLSLIQDPHWLAQELARQYLQKTQK